MSKEMKEKYINMFEEMSKFINDTLKNQEKNNQTGNGTSSSTEN